MFCLSRSLRIPLLVVCAGGLAVLLGQEDWPQSQPKGEYYFVRMEYKDSPNIRRRFSRGWWRQDWPEADVHFTKGVRRLTRLDTGDGRHMPLTDDRIYDHPWMYATQCAYWDLSDLEISRLREYLLRGGFLVADDFYGEEWEVFRRDMNRLFPDRPILDIADDDAVMHVVYDIKERVFIPGLRHLRRGRAGSLAFRRKRRTPLGAAFMTTMDG